MKKLFGIFMFTLIILITCVSGCREKEMIHSFQAAVLETENGLLIRPDSDTAEFRSSDKIYVHVENAQITDASGNPCLLENIVPGDVLKIFYNGMIMESYPAQIHASKIIVTSLVSKIVK